MIILSCYLYLCSSSYYLSSAFFFSSISPPPISTLFPYTTLFRSAWATGSSRREWSMMESLRVGIQIPDVEQARTFYIMRSEEHTSELQSRGHLVCRLLLEKKKTEKNNLVANRLNLNSS